MINLASLSLLNNCRTLRAYRVPMHYSVVNKISENVFSVYFQFLQFLKKKSICPRIKVNLKNIKELGMFVITGHNLYKMYRKHCIIHISNICLK